MKPMKRSRSDQSLNTTVQHLLAAGGSSGGGGGSSSSGHHAYAATPLRSCASEGAPVRRDAAAPGGRSQRQPGRSHKSRVRARLPRACMPSAMIAVYLLIVARWSSR